MPQKIFFTVTVPTVTTLSHRSSTHIGMLDFAHTTRPPRLAKLSSKESYTRASWPPRQNSPYLPSHTSPTRSARSRSGRRLSGDARAGSYCFHVGFMEKTQCPLRSDDVIVVNGFHGFPITVGIHKQKPLHAGLHARAPPFFWQMISTSSIVSSID